MRTPEDILAAKAAYSSNLLETELSSLPEGYVAGGSITISGADAFIAPLIANIGGKLITKTQSTNVAEMDWGGLPRINDTYFHIYLNRYGFWFVNTNEPVTINGLYGLYQEETRELYMGTVYVSTSGQYTKVISWKRIRAEDLDVGTLTAEEIAAGTITATEMNVDALQAMFLDITGQVTIGYEGTGTIESPDEGDRRIYIDGDEISFVEYTDGAWTTVNQIRLGGVDSNSLFYPFLQCRGVINPLADEVNQEFLPDNQSQLYNFENNLLDQNSDNILVENLMFEPSDLVAYTSNSKYGNKAAIAQSLRSCVLESSSIWDETKTQTFATYVYTDTSVVGPGLFGDEGFLSYRLGKGTFYYLRLHVNHDLSIELRTQVLTNSTTYELALTLEDLKYQYLYMVVEDDGDGGRNVTVGVDSKIEITNIGADFWGGADPLEDLSITIAGGFTLDECLLRGDVSTDIDILTQHYNHNVPWNTDASAKDIILKPAEGGKVIAEEGILINGLLSVNEKGGITPEGGHAVKLTNKTGNNTVAGQLIQSSTGTNDAFATCEANSDDCIGIVLNAGVADGSEAWIVTNGIAAVLMDSGGSARGDRIITSATAGSADVWNTGGAVATHFQEIGHCIETRSGTGLARCVLHFN